MKKLNALRVFLLATGLVLAGIADSAQAALFSYTSVGTITSGYDALGLFGAPGGNLAGKAFQLTSSFDLADNLPSVNAAFFQSSLGPAPFQLTAIVDGVTYAGAGVSSAFSYAVLQNALSQGQPGVDFAWAFNSGYDAANDYLSAFQLLTSFTHSYLGVSPDLDLFHQIVSQPGDVVHSNFYFSSGSAITRFDSLDISSVTINGEIPEPEAAALLGLGLLGLAVARGRKAGS